MTKRFFFCVLFALVAFIPQGEWKGEIKVIDGVPHIMNPDKGMQPELGITFKKEWEIGLEEGDENYIFERIVDADVDDEGRIYVLDFSACNVRIFSPEGKHIRTIGRKGQGPGEFTYPVAVSVINPDTFVVVESASHRFSFFDRKGTFLRYFKTEFLGSIARVKAIPGNRFLVTQNSFKMEGNKTFMTLELNIIDSTGKIICKICKRQREITDLLQKKKISQKDTPVISWCFDRGGNIFVVDDIYDYQIQVFDFQGRLLRVIRRKFKLLKKAKEEMEKEQREIEEAQKRLGIDVGIKVELAEEKPIIGAVCVDERGRLWVATSEGAPESGTAFDIFDREGRYLNKVTLNARGGLFMIKGGYLYFANMMGQEIPKFYKYKIVEE